MNIIGNKKIFLGFSALLLIAAIACITLFGLKQGIDFLGGTAWQARFIQSPTPAAIQKLLVQEFKLNDITVVDEPTTKSIIMRLPELSEGLHAQYRETLQKKFGGIEELSYETIGPSIGNELRGKAIYAFLGVLLTISFYIAFAFRGISRPISSWKYGFVTLITLFHDALIPLGMISFLGWYKGVEINTNLIVALLVVIGFSVHDTIVVFDRIRENIRLEKNTSFNFSAIVNKSVNQTMIRSINTSLTLVLVLCALLLFGSVNLFYFILTILVGVIIGTYSSIFIASPLLVVWNKTK